ncbi:MAG TPA: sigma 54-interacting transcriptional regulator [Polyangiaceae bacterium]|nr:sigma 54-interacting transcriptional regulator [Polyangiaceae bacterium]
MSSVHHTTTRLDDRKETRERPRPLAICWLSPGAARPVSTLDRDQLSLGRGAEADLRLNASGVSRLHARLHRQGPIYALHDLSSTNGSYVNGARIQHVGLSENDVLRFGTMVGVVTRVGSDQATPNEVQQLVPGLLLRSGLAPELDQLKRAAKSDLPVVLWGETGVGKERLAQALHVLSGRAGGYHGVNCAALPASLAEAELFGHRRGAFTGADQPGLGYLRAAHQGTLLLDELADLSPPLQAKLLRALQEKAVTPLGETRPIPVDVRIVAACQEPLSALVEGKRLRPDLAARLNGLSIEVPPLRQRRVDIALMFGYFLSQYSGGRPPAVEPELLESLLVHGWPGNVRELEFLARRLLVLHSHESVLRRVHLPGEFAPKRGGRVSTVPTASNRREHDERVFALELQRNGGKIAPAATAANISRQRAYRLLGQRSVSAFLSELATDGEGAHEPSV